MVAEPAGVNTQDGFAVSLATSWYPPKAPLEAGELVLPAVACQQSCPSRLVREPVLTVQARVVFHFFTALASAVAAAHSSRKL